jgi:hypothetical protein
VVQRDTALLKARLDALDAQQALDEAAASHLSDAMTLLGRLQDRVAEIERTNDVLAKQQVMALLVNRIDVETIPATPDHPMEARMTIDYIFSPSRAANASEANLSTRRRSGHPLAGRA